MKHDSLQSSAKNMKWKVLILSIIFLCGGDDNASKLPLPHLPSCTHVLDEADEELSIGSASRFPTNAKPASGVMVHTIK